MAEPPPPDDISHDSAVDAAEVDTPYDALADAVADAAADAAACIPNPPGMGLFPTIDDLLRALNTWAFDYGFSVISKNGSNRRGGKCHYYSLCCTQNTATRASRSTGIRKTATRKIKLPLEGQGYSSQGQRIPIVLRLLILSASHNHGPSSHAAAHTKHREVPQAGLDLLQDISRHTAIKAREARAIVKDYAIARHVLN